MPRGTAICAQGGNMLGERMRGAAMLGLVLPLLCQLLGEMLARFLVPIVLGSVLGIAVFLGLLFLLGHSGNPKRVEQASVPCNVLLRHMGLLFVPAGVGVVQSSSFSPATWLALGMAVVISTLLSLDVTAVVFAGLARWVTRSGT